MAVTTLAGTGELVPSLPPALAMTAADLGVALIARRLVSRRACTASELDICLVTCDLAGWTG